MKQRRWPIIVLSIVAGLFLVYSVIATVAVRVVMQQRDKIIANNEELIEMCRNSLDKQSELNLENAELKLEVLRLEVLLGLTE